MVGGGKRSRNGLYKFKQAQSEAVGVDNIIPSMKKTKIIKKEQAHYEEEEQEEDDEDDEGSDSDGESDEEFEDLAIATGVDTNCAVDMVDMMRLAQENDLNFVCVPLFHPRMRTGETK